MAGDDNEGNGAGVKGEKGSAAEVGEIGEIGGTLNPLPPSGENCGLGAGGGSFPAAAPGQPLPGEGVADLERFTVWAGTGEGCGRATFDAFGTFGTLDTWLCVAVWPEPRVDAVRMTVTAPMDCRWRTRAWAWA